MSDVKSLKGNGAGNGPDVDAHDARSLADHGRQIQHDAATLGAAVRDATRGVQRYLTEQVEQRPYPTIGVAAGIGYVLGGGLTLRLTTLLLGAVARLGMVLAAREFGSRIVQSRSAPAHNNKRFREPLEATEEGS